MGETQTVRRGSMFFNHQVYYKHRRVYSTCVRPGVPLQLVTARETLPAENPVAGEGSLAGVQPDVSSEQRRLPERLLAAGDVADVLPLPDLPGPAACPSTQKHIQQDKP